MITFERLAAVLRYDPETGEFRRLLRRRGPHAKQGSVAGTIHRSGYRFISIEGSRHPAHRLAWLYVHNEWPKHVIDHINGNKADNRIANLRDVPQAVNLQNQWQSRNKSETGVRGVHRHTQNKNFVAQIGVAGKCHHIGSFDTIEAARLAYLDAKAVYHPSAGQGK